MQPSSNEFVGHGAVHSRTGRGLGEVERGPEDVADEREDGLGEVDLGDCCDYLVPRGAPCVRGGRIGKCDGYSGR